MRVLYVEDDENAAKIVERMLLSEGHDCDRARLGEQAVSLARARDYDFMLIDIMLPDIDGYEVISRLRSSGIKTPYLIQSGLVDRDSAFAGLTLGTGEYLIKPFTQEELVSGMEAVVARSTLLPGRYLDEIAGDPRAESDGFEGKRQRKSRRFNTVKAAKIDYGLGIDCRILNISHGGAALRLEDKDARFPPTFFLELKSGQTFHCRVCWRKEENVGVKFLTSAV